jgi:hypothetical protein
MATRKSYTGINMSVARNLKKKVDKKETVGLSAPWETYHKEVWNLFKDDANVTVDDHITEEGNGVYSFAVTSSDINKVAALNKILKTVVPMGNITLKININYEADDAPATAEDWTTAFEGNPLFSTIVSAEPLPGLPEIDFAVFEREIITFFNDDTSDYCGNAHKIVADIVRDVTKSSATVRPCTRAIPMTDE